MQLHICRNRDVEGGCVGVVEHGLILRKLK